MSVKSSTSPTLHLQIADSRTCRALQVSYITLLLFSLVLVYVRGYPVLALCGGLLVACVARTLCRQPWVGAVILWQRGQWRLIQGADEVVVEPMPSCRVTRWATFFRWRSEREKGYVWLFNDSADAVQLRRLRVRLSMQG